MSRQQKALVLPKEHGAFIVEDRAVPEPAPGYILVKIEAAALNPVDWKIQSGGRKLETYPAVLGLDASGVVDDVGEGDVRGFAKGDRVLFEGTFLPPKYENTTFQQYATVPAEIAAKLPGNLTFDQAATVPLGLFTASIGLYNTENEEASAGLKPFWEESGRGVYRGQPIVVFGGSSSVGQYVIQTARLSGFAPIITTASTHNTALLLALGATHVLDRHLPAPALLTAVRAITPAPIELIYDAISLEETQRVAYELLAPGGQLILVLPSVIDGDEIDPGAGKRVKRVSGSAWPPESRKVGARLWGALTTLLKEGAIKPNTAEVLSGGLDAIVGGLERLKNNQVSGLKLVVHPSETA